MKEIDPGTSHDAMLRCLGSTLDPPSSTPRPPTRHIHPPSTENPSPPKPASRRPYIIALSRYPRSPFPFPEVHDIQS